MRKSRVWRGAAPLAVALAGLSTASAAHASHVLAGSIHHRVPNPGGAPLTAEVEVILTWRNAFPVTGIYVTFGDGSSAVVPSSGAVGSVPLGNGFTMSRFVAQHTYPGPGSYQASFSDCCYASEIQNGADGAIFISSTVVVGQGARGGPVAPLMPLVPVQTGGLRTFEIPVADHDGGPTTCALNPVFDPPIIPGGAGPTVTSSPNGCLVTWNTTGALAGQAYRFVLDIGDSDALGQSSMTFVAQMRLGPTPTCTGGGLFTVDLGAPFSKPMLGNTSPAGASLTLSTWEPFGQVTPAAGTVGAAPFNSTYSFMPGPGDEGAHVTTLVFSDAQNRIGLCPVATYVAPCAAFGAACSAGIGGCQTQGFQYCSGGQVLCSAVPGSPEPEACNGADDDCDGTVDDDVAGLGAVCATGLAGVCSVGHMECTSGAPLCPPAVMPGSLPETCDGEDEDCDGLTDEDFSVGMACSAGVGACLATGAVACSSPDSSECDAVAGAPSAEVCDNGVDEDCDGVADDGCPMGGQGGSGAGGSGQGGSAQGGSGQGGSGQGGSAQGGSGQGGSGQGGSAQGGSGSGANGGSGQGGADGGGGSGAGAAGSGAGDSAGSGAGAGSNEDDVIGGCACQSAGLSSAGAPLSPGAPWWVLAAGLLPIARRRRR